MYFCIINLLCFRAENVVQLLIDIYFSKVFWEMLQAYRQFKYKSSFFIVKPNLRLSIHFIFVGLWRLQCELFEVDSPCLKGHSSILRKFHFCESLKLTEKMEAKSKQNKKIMRFIRPWVAPKWVPKAVSVPTTKGWFQIVLNLRRLTDVTNQSSFCKWSYSNWTVGFGIRWCEVFYQKRWSHGHRLDRK